MNGWLATGMVEPLSEQTLEDDRREIGDQVGRGAGECVRQLEDGGQAGHLQPALQVGDVGPGFSRGKAPAQISSPRRRAAERLDFTQFCRPHTRAPLLWAGVPRLPPGATDLAPATPAKTLTELVSGVLAFRAVAISSH